MTKVIVFLTLIIVFNTSSTNIAYSDIRGTTTIKCFIQDNEIPCTGPLPEGGVILGSNLEGTFLEAFIDAAQMLNNLKNAIEAFSADNYPGAAESLKKAYDEAIELQTSGDDKTAMELAYVKLDQAAPYTKVTLTFDALSDDDPFQEIKVAAPDFLYSYTPKTTNDDGGTGGPVRKSNTFSAIIIQPVVWDKYSDNSENYRHGVAVVTLYPKRIPQGTLYPIIFSTKEDNCGICLGIFHQIKVSTYKTCSRVLLPETYCFNRSNQFSNNIDQIQKLYGEAYPLMRELGRSSYVRQKYCGPEANANPKFPSPRGCDDPADERENLGACPQYSWGLSRQTCDRVRSYFEAIKRLEADNVIYFNDIIRNGCCNEYINPNGGPGKNPETEIYQTSPNENIHPEQQMHEQENLHHASPQEHKEQPTESTHDY